MYYYQSTRFNANITIDHTQVGGLTTEQALNKLKSAVPTNTIYIGQKQIYNGKDTTMGFSNQDLSNVKKLLIKQKTIFPSSKVVNYALNPMHPNQRYIQTLENNLKEKLITINQNLTAPQDAKAQVERGQVVVKNSIAGNQYDVEGIMTEFQNQSYLSDIHLNPVYKQPIKSKSQVVQEEKKNLKALINRTLDYKVQGKVYTFNGSNIIKGVTLTKNNHYQYTMNMEYIKKKLNDINQSQSTLNKDFKFKTHDGHVISVKDGTYGWAIDTNKESKRIADAFKKGKKSILAYYVYGKGWSTIGVGYHTTTNNGLGNSYVELSIKDQHLWVYKNGKLVQSTQVVTGTHLYNEDTPKGVWYIEYKQSPSVLKGSEVGNPHYTVKVKYWAPFTLSGDGLHDASWRTKWSSDAYIRNGSGGCVNIPPNVMASVYENISQDEPVIIY